MVFLFFLDGEMEIVIGGMRKTKIGFLFVYDLWFFFRYFKVIVDLLVIKVKGRVVGGGNIEEFRFIFL